MNSDVLDVLIIGAGPVGLTAAAELHRYGLRVRIIDQNAAPTDKSKALVVWPRTLEHLARLRTSGTGLDETFVNAGIKATHGKLFQRDKLLAAIQFDSADSPYRFALMLPQSSTESLLLNHLQSQGPTVERNKMLTALTQSQDSVTATIQATDDTTEILTAAWLIGGDGAHSTTRHLLNADFEGETLPSDWVLADVQIEGKISSDSPELHLHKSGIAAVFPMPHNRFRIIANTSRNKSSSSSAEHAPLATDPTLADIQRVLDERAGPGLRAFDPIWLSAFHINERKVADFRHGRVFLAGDAAHIHSPAGGQGMNTGMQDVFNLAWKLALIHHQRVAPAYAETLLASYNAERSPVAADVLKGSGFLIRMGTLDNAFLRGLRNFGLHTLLGFGKVQHLFAENVTELAIAYPESPLNEPHSSHSGPKPGERFPVRDGDTPISAGNQPRYALFATAGADAEQFIACFPNHLEPVTRPPWKPGTITLVRPDGYVAFSGSPSNYTAMDSYMNRIVYGVEASTRHIGPLLSNG